MARRPRDEERPAKQRPPSEQATHAEPTDGSQLESSQSGNRGPARHRDRDKSEQKFYGTHACWAMFERRPQDIIRVYLTQERVKPFGSLLKWCAEQRKTYHIVENENLERLVESIHHQGIVVLAKKHPRWDDKQLLEQVKTGKLTGPILYLDGVQNPHNVGSILRSAAHFGCGALVGAKDQLPPLSSSAVRVAEGGAEHVPAAGLSHPAQTLAALKQLGYKLFVSSSHQGRSLFAEPFPKKSVLILGSEVHGVSPALLKIADASIQIPGTGSVESLNVSVACGILLAEVWRCGSK